MNEFTDAPLLAKKLSQKGLGMLFASPDNQQKELEPQFTRHDAVRISIADKNDAVSSQDITSANDLSSDVKTEISSREVQEVDYMERMATGQLRRPDSPKTKILGKYV